MPDEEPGTDASPSMTCTFTSDELDDSPIQFNGKFTIIECSRPVWEGAESARCVWHVEQTGKPLNELDDTVQDGTLVGARAWGKVLMTVSFPESPVLTGAGLSDAKFGDVDLSGAEVNPRLYGVGRPPLMNGATRREMVSEWSARRGCRVLGAP